MADSEPTRLLFRGATILPTAMGALAWIVISYVADTWEFIPREMQRHAFVVVNAAGAHFILSMLIAVPFAATARWVTAWYFPVSTTVGYFFYGYWALLIQHKGLTDVLLSERWVSAFPLTDLVFPLLYGRWGEPMFYALPLLLAWGAALACFIAFGAADQLLRRRTSAPKSPRPTPVSR